jgi:hypothetical protein
MQNDHFASPCLCPYVYCTSIRVSGRVMPLLLCEHMLEAHWSCSRVSSVSGDITVATPTDVQDDEQSCSEQGICLYETSNVSLGMELSIMVPSYVKKHNDVG